MRRAWLFTVVAAATCVLHSGHAYAQLTSALDAQVADNMSRFSLISMGALDRVDAHDGTVAFAARAMVPWRQVLFDIDGAMLTSAGPSASAFGARITIPYSGSLLRLRVSGARDNTDPGHAIAAAGIEFLRQGLSFAMRAGSAPGAPATYRDTTIVLAPDTSITTHVLQAGSQSRQRFAVAEAGYQRAFSRITVGATVSARMDALQSTNLAALLNMRVRIVNAISAGASFGRDATPDWLRRGAHNALTLYMRIDPSPTTTAAPRAVATAEPRAIVTQDAQTRIIVEAHAATSVEITGDFSDWNPVPLARSGATWSATLQDLPPGLYHLSVRIDHGEWIAPHGLPSVTDEFGGSSAVFAIGDTTPHV